MHLKQPGFTYSACGPFTKHCERIQKFRETGNLKHLYRNVRAYEIARNCRYDGYQRALASMVYMFFDKKTGSAVRVTSKAGISVNEKLAEELHKPLTKKFKKRKVYASFKDNILTADLALK